MSRVLIVIVCLSQGWSAAAATGGSVPSTASAVQPLDLNSSYYWRTTPASGGSELLTLFRSVEGSDKAQPEIPLVSIFRDAAASTNPAASRLRYVWLLPSRGPSIGQRMLAGIPFFFWGTRGEPSNADLRMPAPIADLSEPTPRVVSQVGQSLMQWTAFDPTYAAVRTSSRTYRSNQSDNERVRLQETIAYLRNAPCGKEQTAETPLTAEEIRTTIARLSLMNNLLGGLMKNEKLSRVANQHEELRLSTIGRNWELLRSSAERAGLTFEPFRLAGSGEDQAILWYRKQSSLSTPGVSLAETWKLLHISDPHTDSRIANWKGYTETRSFDSNGRLLPRGETGVEQAVLIPLAVYSLTYPRAPLLLADFRSGLKPKIFEITQRGLTEVTSGVLGLSRFGNWYYYAGYATFQFVQSRHGSAQDKSARLDSLAEFRAALAIDESLTPEFRELLHASSSRMIVNPLNSPPTQDTKLAHQNFQALELAANDPDKLPKRVEKDRRHELAIADGANRTREDILHFVSFGAYTKRVPESPDNVLQLANRRAMEEEIQFLSKVAGDPAPEVRWDPSQIQSSVDKLSHLLEGITSTTERDQAIAVVDKIRGLTVDSNLKESCEVALERLRSPEEQIPGQPGGVQAIISSK